MTELTARVPEVARSIEVLRRAGLFNPLRPDEALRSTVLIRRYGPIAGAVRIAAGRDRKALALVDEHGELSFTQLDERSNALARGWARAGLGEGSVIAVLCRDHRGLVDSMLASAKLGARLLLVNTGFSAPQLVDVSAREEVSAVVYDQEFTGLLAALPTGIQRYLAWVDDAATAEGLAKIDELITSNSVRDVPLPAKVGGLVLLTSGTTGTPKGAQREVKSPLAAAEFLDRIPLRSGEATFLGAPIFHGTGLSQFILTFALGSTVILRRRFDPVVALEAIERYRCTALVVVPTMLARILDLGPAALDRADTSSLRIVFTAGSALSPELGNRATRAFGPVIHNLYGSTEVAVATVATPQDWAAAPGTVGRAPAGCRVRLYDAEGNQVHGAHRRGRVFVRSGLKFGGYTGGGNKEIIDGLLCSGDVGHFDESGLLFIDGRDDDMIVSGGENVYPIEVENLLVEHEKISDAAVIGIADDEFGQRLKAFVVTIDGAPIEVEEIKSYVKANLARYKVPREVEFLDELPRNPTGKVLKNQLS
ncbi:MAG: acyl-CoA synthetase [Sciscionella sp.]